MSIALDHLTRKKLILVRQLYQRALLQSEAPHSYVDRILALIVFDLTNETVLKAVVAALDASKTPASDFQGIVQQADNLLAGAGLPATPDKAKIRQVRALRNDAQHKARYPNDTDVSECRTYTRDFLHKIVLGVWGQGFESISLVDEIQNAKVKGYLGEAQAELANRNYSEAVIKAEAALTWIIDEIKGPISGGSPRNMVVGLDFRLQTEYKRILDPIVQGISFAEDGHYRVHLGNRDATPNEAEFAVTFAVDAVIQIQNVLGDVT